MPNNPSKDGIPSDADLEALKKTTRISLEEALSSMSTPQKAAVTPAEPIYEKQATGIISGIPTHTAPIPQTIRLKRPSTSPIVISGAYEAGAAPTVAKVVHAKPPSTPIAEAPTIVKKASTSKITGETSRIILEIDEQAATVRQKTAPVPVVSSVEATPPPKTIRLKKPSPAVPTTAPVVPEKTAAPEVQMAKKSETAKIELPKTDEFQAPTTQRKTIKIRRTDRNVMPRTIKMVRPGEEKKEAPPPSEATVETVAGKEESVTPETAAAIAPETAPEETIIVFPIAAGLAAVFLLLLVYLLAAQAFPGIALPVPSGLF